MKNEPIYFVDVETTGLDHRRDRIIEFCIIKSVAGHFIESVTYKVDPEGMRIHPEAQKVNGYSFQKWRDAISQQQAAGIIADFMRDTGIMCSHNVSFDAGFINTLLLKHGYRKQARRKIDTYTLAYEHLVPLGLKNLSFDEIRRFMGWKVHGHHDAKTDTFDLFRFYKRVNRMGMSTKLYLYIRSISYRMRTQ